MNTRAMVKAVMTLMGLGFAMVVSAAEPTPAPKQPGTANVDGISKPAGKPDKSMSKKDANGKLVGPSDSKTKSGKDKMTGGAMMKEGGDKGGKDKMGGGAMSKEGGDKDGGKGGKDKMTGGAMMKEGGEGKGGKDKMLGNKGVSNENVGKGGKDKMGAPMGQDASQMRDAQKGMSR